MRGNGRVKFRSGNGKSKEESIMKMTTRMNRPGLVYAMLAGLLVAAPHSFAADQKTMKKTDQPAMNENAKSSVTNDLMMGWKDQWDDGTPSGAKFSQSGKNLTVTGNSKMSYGSVFKVINVDLDPMPYLVIDVDSANGFWYLIAKNQNLRDGYVRIQPDTDQGGKYIYDLKAITRLAGKQNIELDLGISSGKDESNAGKTISFKEIKLSQNENLIPGALRTSGWKEKFPDGSATGATVKEDKGGFTVTGISKDKSYGPVYRIVTVNLDKTPILKVTPTAVVGKWYVEMMGGNIKSPVKVQQDTQTQTQTYYLKNLLGLSGEQSFELHIGISSGGKDPNAGKEVSFKDLSFVAEGASGGSGSSGAATSPATPSSTKQ